MWEKLPLRLAHSDETARLLGFKNKNALRRAREKGYLPEGSYIKSGGRWYYLTAVFVREWGILAEQIQEKPNKRRERRGKGQLAKKRMREKVKKLLEEKEK